MKNVHISIRDQRLTLKEVSVRAGIDQAALSRLETGMNGNPTLETLYRIAAALGKEIVCVLQEAGQAAPRAKRKQSARAG